MPSIHDIFSCFHTHTTQNQQPVSPLPPEPLKAKIKEIWNQFLITLHVRPKIPVAQQIQIVTQQIQTAIAKVNAAETQKEQKPVIVSLLQKAFAESNTAMAAVHMNPKKLPAEVALQIAEIVGRFGIAIYSNNDVPNSFNSSLTTLKLAIVVHEYALGLRKACPDFSKAKTIDDFYLSEALSKANTKLADKTIASMKPAEWAEKASSLSQSQQILINRVLRYTNGALRYLEIKDIPTSGRLLETAEAVMQQCLLNPDFDQVEVKDQMAELIYNDLTGFYAAKAEDYATKGQTELAAETKAEITKMWDRCIELSKEPQKMRARCDNKRCFIEKLTLDQELELRKSSLERHIALPEEQQDQVLIALSFHNIANLFDRLEMPKEALTCAVGAMQIVVKCKHNGENNAQFDNIIAQTNKFLEKYRWVFDVDATDDTTTAKTTSA